MTQDPVGPPRGQSRQASPRVPWTLTAFSALMLCTAAQQPAAQQPPPGVVVTQKGNVTNYETRDNLRSFHHLDCVEVQALTSDDTPADIYPAVRRCIDGGDLQRAARLYAIAGAYGRFDTLRVLDTSAHQAVAVLQLNNFGNLGSEEKERLRSTIKAISSSDQIAGLCTQARKLGSPTYYPTYMTQHGLSAFTGKGGGLKQEFNAAEAWESSLASYLHCPPPAK